MMYFVLKANNYWQAFKKKISELLNKRIMWWFIKLALLDLRLVCYLIDLFDGVGSDD